MSLSTDPSMTANSKGNIINNVTVTNGTPQTATIDFSTNSLGGFVQVWNVPGTASTTSGLQVQIFATADGTNFDTVAFAGTNFTIPSVTSTTAVQSVFLPTGKYQINLQNLDASHTVAAYVTSAPVA
jgi:hypothetical protein